MIRSPYILRQVAELLRGIAEVLLGVAVVEHRWNRDRRRRIATMLQREQRATLAAIDHADAMAVQLAEILALPEALER